MVRIKEIRDSRSNPNYQGSKGKVVVFEGSVSSIDAQFGKKGKLCTRPTTAEELQKSGWKVGAVINETIVSIAHATSQYEGHKPYTATSGKNAGIPLFYTNVLGGTQVFADSALVPAKAKEQLV